MTDIATLGLAVDSSQVTTATGALTRFAAAAAPAASAAAAVTNSASGVSATMASATQATNVATKAHAGMSTQAMAASHSIRSMVEQLALGVPPTQILAQQMNHLSYAASGPGGIKGAFTEAAGALRSLLSPTTLMVGGLAAVAGGMYLWYERVKEAGIAIGNLSERTMTAVGALHQLESAAAFKGIGSADFIKGMERFGTLTSEAKDKLGSLGELFRANGVSAGTMEQNLAHAADLIRSARDEADKYRIVTMLGLPATREWVQFLSQGSEGLKRARAEATDLNHIEMETLVARAREFDEAWNKGWANFSTSAKNAFLNIYGNFNGLRDLITTGLSKVFTDVPQTVLANAIKYGTASKLGANSDVDQFYKGIGAFNQSGPLKVTVNPDALKQQLSLQNQQIGLLGNLATVQQTVKAKENELTLARLAGVGGLDKYKDAILRVTQFQAEQTKLQAAAAYGIFDTVRQEKNAQLEIQTLVDNKTIQNANDYAAAWAVITKRIRESSDAAAVARSPFEQLTRYSLDAANSAKQFDQFATASFGNIESSFADFVTGAKDAKTAFTDLTNSILKDLARLVIRQNITGPLASALTGGAAGLFGNGGNATIPSASFLDHGFGFHSGGSGVGEASFMRSVPAGTFRNAPRFHTGVGPGEVPAIIRNDESVLTPAQMRQLAPVGQGGGGPIIVNVNNAPAGTSAQVQQTRTPGGGMQLDITLKRMVDDAVASNINSGQSATHDSLVNRFGLTPKL